MPDGHRITLRMSDEMVAFIGGLIDTGEYEHSSEYLRDLVRRDRRRRARESLEQKLLAAMESGPATPWSDADFEGIGERLLRDFTRKGADEPD